MTLILNLLINDINSEYSAYSYVYAIYFAPFKSKSTSPKEKL